MNKKLTALAAAALMAGGANAGTLVINTDDQNPAPKAAFEYAIDSFKAANPDVTVEWNNFDREGYKTRIRNFLTADAPDVATWYPGNRMAPFVDAGLFMDISDVWAAEGLDKEMASTQATMSRDGKQYMVPYSYYQWGIYYRKDLFDKVGAEVPETWDELLATSATLKENGITPFTIGSKFKWTTGGWFDYLNLRSNGYEFHMDLTAGKVPYTDSRVQATFDRWDELVNNGYFIENHATYNWQEGMAPMVQGDAAMYLIGNFAVAPFKEAGLTEDQLGFFQFPEITKGLPMAEDAPADAFFIPAGAKNVDDAKKFLAHIASPMVQTEMNKILGQLPPSSAAQVNDDPYLNAGFEMLSGAYALAQFYDRDAPAAMAKAGMDGFQEYMVKPDRRAAILENLDRVMKRAYQ
ncbi:extracellular solute-binding protein [Litorivicinus lipolyticus]|uniref:Extracellular solute-binding protein n=1 Tax=Litorivicinus lipolyticus TaxID=418701 RepID=A0A5Q2QFL1_9GAMM|nr:extracellular solute-binding protein [Litorivicinus lipolyticus]QGG81132.1 extracellular solute-binding protein [Litorivicinus lipolyticus]